jgi:transcriptional regulator with XRE-family HTH domain
MKKRSPFLKNAELRIKNSKWLSYSSNIARRILAGMEEKSDMSQKELAESVGVSQQYISKVVKGDENLTLETIAKISDALDVELITFPAYKDDSVFFTLASVDDYQKYNYLAIVWSVNKENSVVKGTEVQDEPIFLQMPQTQKIG